MKTVRFLLEWTQYPLWLYDDDGSLIDPVAPPELSAHPEILERVDVIQKTYDSLFIDDPHTFEFRGFDTPAERAEFLRTAHETCRLIEEAVGDVYRVVDDIVLGGDMEITCVQGDITTQQVDAIVNAANSMMRGGGGVDGAIHAAGGRAILEDCRRRFPHGLEVGQAGWTTAGDLPARWVIHVVGPNWHRGQTDHGLLASCYSNALKVAAELGAASVAFPLVSAGAYGWPLEDAVDWAVHTLRGSGSSATSVREARLVAYDRRAYEAITARLRWRG